MAASTSLKDYLKRYESNDADEDKKKKKKKKKPRAEASGVLIVDEDPVWQKPVILEKEEEYESPDEKPQVDEDIEVKRMKRLEQLRARRSYHEISEDGSGWVSVNDNAVQSDVVALNQEASDISPPRQQRRRYDSLSPEPPAAEKRKDPDLSPPRKRSRRHASDGDDDLSPPRQKRGDLLPTSDLSPPRQRRRRRDSDVDADLSPPRQHRRRHDSDGDTDLSPPRQRQGRHYSQSQNAATSTPSRPRRHDDSPSPVPDRNQSVDISPPRRPKLKNMVDPEKSDGSDVGDLSPPRRERRGSPTVPKGRGAVSPDLSPPRKTKEKGKTGLVTGKDIKEEIMRKRQEEMLRFELMDPSISGKGAEPVYRDKLKGVRISKDEFAKSQKKEDKKPKEEKKLEWGKGLAQKREAEAKQLELEVEKDKPFARTRDDPDLDRMLKDAIRWGDPMAHLVKRKQSASALPDLGDDEKMKESGFVVPQEIPNHSWIKRGLEAAPNRYGIRPGRHWDGVDRSTGYEKELFKRTNEKRATEREAYLWSVSDM